MEQWIGFNKCKKHIVWKSREIRLRRVPHQFVSDKTAVLAAVFALSESEVKGRERQT